MILKMALLVLAIFSVSCSHSTKKREEDVAYKKSEEKIRNIASTKSDVSITLNNSALKAIIFNKSGQPEDVDVPQIACVAGITESRTDRRTNSGICIVRFVAKDSSNKPYHMTSYSSWDFNAKLLKSTNFTGLDPIWIASLGFEGNAPVNTSVHYSKEDSEELFRLFTEVCDQELTKVKEIKKCE